MAEGKEIRVITPQRYKRDATDDEYVLPVAIMGAPTVLPELISSPEQIETALNAMMAQKAVTGALQDSSVPGT